MKQLILAEKPSVGRDIVNAIGGSFTKRDGYFENDQYIVSWAIGHLVELFEPEDYNPSLKRWQLSTLPIIPDSFQLKPNPKTIKQYQVVKQLLSRPDVELIAGTDAGREGELILRYIMRLAGYNRPFKRLWLSETTPEAIRKGLANPLPGHGKDLLAAAAESRSYSDWLIGINATRVFTKKHGDLFSIGRVQTPTLGIIVAREREIKTFTPVQYWELLADFTKHDGQTYQGKWFKNKDETRFDQEADAIKIKDKIAGQTGSIIKMEEKNLSEAPPTLFNLNDLQKEANKKFGFTASQTLEIAQSLYEKHKLLSYPRTEFKHLTNELAKTIPSRLGALEAVPGYAHYVAYAKKAPKPGKRFIDDSKVGDHHALIPTNVKPTSNLSSQEAKIYNLVARRFLAMFFPAAEYKQTKITTAVIGETFQTSGRIELSPGWKEVIPPQLKGDKKDKEEEEVLLPPLVKGENVVISKTALKQKKTEPPKRYTEGTLLAVMEGAGKFVDDQALKDVMKGHGLGTSATRAAIIERLIKVGYLERKGKALIPTEKGETLADLVPEVVSSPQMTGEWEKALIDIEAGQVNPTDFMTGIVELTKRIVNLIKEQPTKGNNPNAKQVVGPCPVCGRDIVEYPKNFACSGYREGCKFSLGKQILQKAISFEEAKQLVTEGKILCTGFTSAKTGKKFDAALVLKQGKISFDFS